MWFHDHFMSQVAYMTLVYVGKQITPFERVMEWFANFMYLVVKTSDGDSPKKEQGNNAKVDNCFLVPSLYNLEGIPKTA